ncbi:MAG TPA: UDP-N-acetylmuramoyl-tripeptide--D-alanyl-D-alanine ligase [Bacteroidales bacterium]|nr:UDP-N-acetylmuramoyl-tripeptide--D-alanyl-D-alanine ligase [Bacteroidales bacterium]HRW94398.1 UDP-N-acetylmuramoyl-tripeptide--D-alanyl-D-alanine ligase [Bacteroidales bacterium]
MKEKLYSLFLKHPDICTDTRQIRPGCIFFALRGERFDGNLFAREALGKGAAFAVVDNCSGEDPRLIRVPDVLEALQHLSVTHRKTFNIPVIALTGSNGKTTTRELIHAVLATRYCVTATQGNLNNHIGVPLSILKMNNKTQAGLFEMGASNPGEIAFLTEMVKPDAGLITNISGAHMEGFGTIEGVKKCKGALYDYLASSGGVVFYNADDPVLCRMMEERNIKEEAIAYGAGVQKVKAAIREGVLQLQLDGYPLITTNLAGMYNMPNVLAALAVGKYYGTCPLESAQAVTSYKPSNYRSQWVQTSRNRILADAYNANPVSMVLSLESFYAAEGARKCLILGDMLELGTDSHMEHLKIVDLVTKMKVEKVYWVGPLFSAAVKERGAEGMCYPHVDALIACLEKDTPDGLVILIKGSNGIRLTKLIASGVFGK